MMIIKLVKNIFRKIIFPVIYFLRLQILFSYTNKNKRLIINYHGVIEKENLKYNGRHFSRKTFEEHLVYYKKNFHVVPLAEIFDMYRQNLIPSKNTIAITFDDGFENNYVVAFPLLKKYNLPATFFVSSICAEKSNAILWPEVISILRQHEDSIIVNNNVFIRDSTYNFLNVEKKILLSDYIKQCKVDERDKIIEDISNKYNLTQILENIEPDIWKLLNKEQIKILADSGLIEIASHGYFHYNLANVTLNEALNDLRKSKEILENITKTKIESIAFPDSSYNKSVKEISMSLGYRNMCAVTYQNIDDEKDENILPRFGMSATTNYYSNIIFLHKAFNKSGF